jgi:hypothetical protein
MAKVYGCQYQLFGTWSSKQASMAGLPASEIEMDIAAVDIHWDIRS